jgi:hypothetical protein
LSIEKLSTHLKSLLAKKFPSFLNFLIIKNFPPLLNNRKVPFSPELLEVQGVVSVQVQLVKEVVQLLSCKKVRSRSLHCKKRLSFFPSPAGMSLTKLSQAGNNLIILVSDNLAGDGKKENLFYSVPFRQIRSA